MTKARLTERFDSLMKEYEFEHWEDIDSLGMMDIIMGVEDTFNVTVPLNITDGIEDKESFLDKIFLEYIQS